MSDEMLEPARHHAAEAGADNAEFLKGRIENIPLPDASVDAVISNCVITLSTDKPAVGVRVTAMTIHHADQVLEIYQAGIDTGDATFETDAPTWDAFDATRLPAHRLVALDDGNRVLGWTAVSAVSDRCAYVGVVEHSVYVHPDARGRGVGHTLLNALLASTDAAGIWTVQSGVFPENTASLALHAAAGFRTVGIRERLGRHHGHWRDVILLEHRSRSIN